METQINPVKKFLKNFDISYMMGLLKQFDYFIPYSKHMVTYLHLNPERCVTMEGCVSSDGEAYKKSEEKLPFTFMYSGTADIRFGLKMSQGMQKVIKQYEKDNDLVLQFLEEKCERNAEGKTRAKSLYDNYKMWCKGNGYYVCSMKKFNAELTAHPEWYADKAVTQGVLFYYGVALRQN